MTPLFLTLLLLLAMLLVGEFVLWRMFRRRVDPVLFPSDQDQSSIGFFRPGRMRFVAICHTVALGACVLLSVLWLW
jgi:hypothetical protein